MSSQDNYGYFGPQYSFADNIPLPGSIGVRQDPSVGAILDSVSAVNTYVDIIAFGGRTFFDQQDLQPMGIRYFLNTDMRCSNGATMSAYFDGVTKGDLLGSAVAKGLASAGLPGLKGLAPGMLENARDALDPRPIFAAVTGTGYPVCQQVQCPVGDVNGSIANVNDPGTAPYILDPTQPGPDGKPVQTRWVQAYDATGAPISISKDEFAATPKCYNADGTYMSNPPAGCPRTAPASTATAGAGPYALCQVTQPATLPPTLQVGPSEGFTSGDGAGAGAERGIATAAVVALGLVGLWAWIRK
jgi:hypothetical protein